jgi:hypothetical protein
LLLPEP